MLLQGFFFAAYMWFVVPTAMSFSAAMTYFSMSFQNGTHLLSAVEIDDGEESYFRYLYDNSISNSYRMSARGAWIGTTSARGNVNSKRW